MPAYSFKFADPWTGVVQTYERSVTWTKVSLKEAKIRATPKTSSPVETCCQRMVPGAIPAHGGVSRFGRFLPSRTWGPREMFSWGARTGAFLGAMATVFGRLGWYSRDRWSRRRKEEVSRLAMPRAAGRRIGKCPAKTRSCRLLSPSAPAADGVRALPLFLRHFIQSCRLSLLLSHLLFTTLILTHTTT